MDGNKPVGLEAFPEVMDNGAAVAASDPATAEIVTIAIALIENLSFVMVATFSA